MDKSLYIHFPYCKHLCNYCDFYKKPLGKGVDHEWIEKGLERNFLDANQIANKFDQDLSGEFKTIYLGGGTPSLWDVEGANFMRNFLQERDMKIAKDCEFTLEIDPGAWTEEGILAWKDLGVNRFSVGVQSYDPEFLKVMDRAHNIDEVNSLLKRLNGENFSVDLMIGLPFSEDRNRSVTKELEMLLKFNPKHFSVYILKTRGNYPHNDYLPEDEYISDEYLKVSDFLNKKGFIHYEVSNFGLEGMESKHNRMYWDAKTVHALGPNATGFVTNGNTAARYQHKPSNLGVSTEKLSENELLLEKVYLGLRTIEGLNIGKYLNRTESQLSNLFERWSEFGYLSFQKGSVIGLNPKGYLFIDSIMDDIFRENLL